MSYNELKKKYMLHEISKEEYEKGKKELVRKLFEMLETKEKEEALSE